MAIEWVDGWAAPRVRALGTLRFGAGASLPPFDRFNLGDRCGDDPEAVAANRAQLSRLGGLPSAPCWLRQVHGVRVVRVGEGDADRPAVLAEDEERAPGPEGAVAGVASSCIRDGQGGAPEADAAVTSVPGVVLAVLTADCLPVVLAAVDGSEVAVAHAGWRGLAGGVLAATVAAMRTPPARLQAWLGPAAGPQAYEVGEEVRAAFLAVAARGGRGAGASFAAPGRTGGEGAAAGGDAPGPTGGEGAAAGDAAAAEAAFLVSRAGHWWCDLYALARWRLRAAQVTDVRGGTRCTISEPQAFFSHRRDGRSGRMATLAWLAPS